MAVPLSNLFYLNRSVVRIQGGYFFMYFMTSVSATNKIINNAISVINITPNLRG